MNTHVYLMNGFTSLDRKNFTKILFPQSNNILKVKEKKKKPKYLKMCVRELKPELDKQSDKVMK